MSDAQPADEPSLKDRLDEVDRRLREHPGYIEHLEIEALGRTLQDVFLENWHELLGLLEQAARDVGLAFELVQNVREPTVRRQFQAAAARQLHNYLASAMTLVDHTRRLMRGRTGPIIEEFNDRKAALLSHPEVPFLQDLRNYTLHRKLPPLGHRVSMTNPNGPDAEMSSEVELPTAALLSWDGWSQASREFLEACGGAVELRPVIRTHGDLLYALNSWLLNELALANQPALAEANELVVERNAILTGGDKEAARVMSVAPWNRPTDDQFP